MRIVVEGHYRHRRRKTPFSLCQPLIVHSLDPEAGWVVYQDVTFTNNSEQVMHAERYHYEIEENVRIGENKITSPAVLHPGDSLTLVGSNIKISEEEREDEVQEDE